jgi:hypothetical protein
MAEPAAPHALPRQAPPHGARARRACRLAAVSLAALCALTLCACAGTLQDRPIPHNILEGLIQAPFPVYWLGRSFQGMPIGEATHDPSDAVSVQYGNCLEGGEGGCIPPVRVVTSPDNSFLPGGSTPMRTVRIRGVAAQLAQGGRTIVLATAGVVVDVYAIDAQMAQAAARTLVPINAVGSPEAPLPAALANTGFGEMPLPSQLPPPLRPLG